MTSGTDQVIASFNRGQSAAQAFALGLRSLGSSLASLAGFAAVAAAAVGLYKAINQAKEANEKAQKSFEAYKTSKKQLENINIELEETNRKIAELEAKGNLTIYEKNELSNLKQISAELEKQRDLQIKMNAKDARAAAKDAYDAYQKNFKGADFLNTWHYDDIRLDSSKALDLRMQRDAATNEEEWIRLNAEAKKYEDKAWGYVSDLQEYLNIFNDLPEEDQIQYRETIEEINWLIDSTWKKLDPTKWKTRKFDEIFNNKDLQQSIKSVRSFASDLGKITKDTIQKVFPEIETALLDAGLEVQDFVDIINSEITLDAVVNTSDAAESLSTTIESLDKEFVLFGEAQNSITKALKESASATGLTTDSITALTSAYSEIEGFDPTRLFERTANGIHLNEQYLKELNAELASNQLQSALEDVARIQDELATARANGDDTSALELELIRAQQLTSQYQGLLSAYNAWETAKSGGNERDSYASVGSGYEDMKKILEQGWYGDESLNAYLDLLLGVDNRTGDVIADFEKLNQTITGTSHSLMDYWQLDEDDKLVTDGLFDFLDDVNKKFGDTFAGQDENGYYFDFTGDKIQQVADAFGTSTEMIQLFARALSDAGVKVQMDSHEVADEVEEAKEEIKQNVQDGFGGEENDFQVDVPVNVEVQEVEANDPVAESEEKLTQQEVTLKVTSFIIGEGITISPENYPEVKAKIIQYFEAEGVKADDAKVDASIIQYLIAEGVKPDDPDVNAEILNFILTSGATVDDPKVNAEITSYLISEGVKANDPSVTAKIIGYIVNSGVSPDDPNLTANIIGYLLSESAKLDNPQVNAQILSYIVGENVKADDPNVNAQIIDFLLKENVKADDPNVSAQITNYIVATGITADDPKVNASIVDYLVAEGIKADDPQVHAQIAGYLIGLGVKANDPNVNAKITDYIVNNNVVADDPEVNAQIASFIVNEGVSATNPNVSANIIGYIVGNNIKAANPDVSATVTNYIASEGVKAEDPNVTANITEYLLAQGVSASNPNVSALISKYIVNAGISPDDPSVTANITSYLVSEGVAPSDPNVTAYIKQYLLKTLDVKPDDPLVNALIANYIAKEGYTVEKPDTTANITGYSAAEDLANPTVTVEALPGDTTAAWVAMQAQLDKNPLKQHVEIVGEADDNSTFAYDVSDGSNGEKIERLKQTIQDIKDVTSKGGSILGGAFEKQEEVTAFLDEINSLPKDVQIEIGISESSAGDIEAIYSELQNPFDKIFNDENLQSGLEALYDIVNDTTTGITVSTVQHLAPQVASALEAAGLEIQSFVDLLNSGLPDTKEVDYEVDAPEEPEYKDQDPQVSYNISAPEQPVYDDIHRTVYYDLQTTSQPSSLYSGTLLPLPGHANGTAYNTINWRHAYANGRVDLSEDEMALVNELGRESLIRDGQWMLLPPGMHQQALKKGDIILSAAQTKALLNTGSAPGHGRALANGTLSHAYAYYAMNPTLLGTGGQRRHTTTSSHSVASSSSSSKSSSSSSSSSPRSSSSSSDSSSNESESETSFDWIEVKIDRLERKIKELQRTADDVYVTFKDRNNALQSQISKTTDEIDVQLKAADAYKKAADAVGLSSDWKSKVQSGDYSLDDVTDKDLSKQISKYKQLYEKYLNCKDAADELSHSLGELTRQRFDNTITQWDNAVQKLAHSIERTESLIGRRSDFASEYVKPVYATEASLKNINSYQTMIAKAEKEQNKRRKELAALNKQLNDALSNPNSGIKKGSEGYYDMLASIQDVENEIDSLGENIIGWSNDISAEYANMFDAIATKYGNTLELAQHKANEFSNALDIATARGYVTSRKYYDELIKIEAQNIKTVQAEANELQKSLNTAIAKNAVQVGSEEWQRMTEEINEANEAVQEHTLSMIKYQNSIRDLDWEKFDTIQEKISEMTEESKFLADLFANEKLFDDIGNITDAGKATAGLYGMNFNTYMNQADQYAQEIAKLNKDIANDPANTTLLKRRSDLLKAQRDSIKAAEDEKQAIKSLVKDGIDAQLSSLQELITEYKDALDSQKDIYDYQKKVAEQTKNIANLQKQLSAYSNDASEESRAKIQKLSEQLTEAQDELRETEYDRYISDQKKLLDSFYDEYERLMNERLDNIDALIGGVIDAVNNDSTNISETLKTKADSVGYSLSKTFLDVWAEGGDAKKIIDLYGTGFTEKLTTLNTAVNGIGIVVDNLYSLADQQAKEDYEKYKKEQDEKAKKESKAEKKADKKSNDATSKAQSQTDLTGSTKGVKTTTTSSKSSDSTKDTTETKQKTKKKKTTTSKWGSWFISEKNGYPKSELDKDYSIVDRLAYFDINSDFANRKVYYGKMGGTGTYAGTAEQNAWMIAQMKAHGYKSGTKRVGYSGLAWTQEGAPETFLRSSDHAVLTRVGNDDRIYNAMASENLWQAANNPPAFILNNLPSHGGYQNGLPFGAAGNNVTLENLEINLEGIKDWGSFMYAAQHSSEFEKLIQAMTVDRMVGRSKNAKYKY